MASKVMSAVSRAGDHAAVLGGADQVVDRVRLAGFQGVPVRVDLGKGLVPVLVEGEGDLPGDDEVDEPVGCFLLVQGEQLDGLLLPRRRGDLQSQQELDPGG